MGTLLLLFIGLPAVELYLLIQIGTAIGAAATVGLILVTGVVGASLARSQGLRVLAEVQQELAEGRLPAASLVDGLMILVAAALLVTPGIVTDVVGFLCLTPGFRRIARGWMLRRLEQSVAEQRFEIHVDGVRVEPPPRRRPEPFGRGPVIDVDPEPSDASGGSRSDG